MTVINAFLAVEFDHTADATYDLRFTFASGTSPVNVPLTTGTYKMHLTTAATDVLRVLQALANAALLAAGRTETVAITLTAEGLVQITMSGGSWATIVFSTNLAKLLGIATSLASGSTITGSRMPWYTVRNARSPWQIALRVVEKVWGRCDLPNPRRLRATPSSGALTSRRGRAVA